MIAKYTEEEYNSAKSSDKLPLVCEKCGTVFYVEKKAITYAMKHPERRRLRFCSKECLTNYNKKERYKTTCAQCGKEIEISYSEYTKSKTKRFFCSHSCAVTYSNKNRTVSEEQKMKTSLTMRTRYLLEPTRICMCCGKSYTYHKGLRKNTRKFCSPECSKYYREHKTEFLSDESRLKLSINGRHSVQKQQDNRRSKNEILFCELCEAKFNNVKHNELLFNGWDADVVLDDYKLAILWNGPWHYKEISKKISLSQIQNRDNIKIKEIQDCGYTPYIIKDMGKYNPDFVKQQFEILLEYLNTAGCKKMVSC